jgi:hypothetical protein
MMSEDRAPTFGEKLVGLSFNPSGDKAVHEMKKYYADIIDQLQEVRRHTAGGEKLRCLSIAITEAQTAQMWAVKALTWKD